MNVDLLQIGLPLAGFDRLEAEARREGHEFLARMKTEWATGKNRFALPGELVLGAYVSGELIGIGGLNCDPYTSAIAIARLRHIYVLPAYRFAGVASALTSKLVATARTEGFRCVRLRTANPSAARVYERHGFARVSRDDATHELLL